MDDIVHPLLIKKSATCPKNCRKKIRLNLLPARQDCFMIGGGRKRKRMKKLNSSEIHITDFSDREIIPV